MYGGNDVNGKILRENCTHWDTLYGPSWLSLFCIQRHNSPYLGLFYEDQKTFVDKVSAIKKVLSVLHIKKNDISLDLSFLLINVILFRPTCTLPFSHFPKVITINIQPFHRHIKEKMKSTEMNLENQVDSTSCYNIFLNQYFSDSHNIAWLLKWYSYYQILMSADTNSMIQSEQFLILKMEFLVVSNCQPVLGMGEIEFLIYHI